MPLKKGNSKKVFKENVKEIMDSYKKKGRIGISTPKDKGAAIKQSVAIAYSEKRKGKKKSSKK